MAETASDLVLQLYGRPRANDESIPEPPQDNQVDLKSLEYIDQYDHNLMCAICHNPFVNPSKLNCDHVFCQDCVIDAINHQVMNPDISSVNCPSCRREIDTGDIRCVPKILVQILDGLRVYCPLKNKGCGEKLARGEVQSHVDNYCAYSEVDCPTGNCKLKVQRKDEEKQRCLHGTVRCRDCLDDFMEKDLEHHRNRTCALAKSQCPACCAQVLNREFEAHIMNCPDAVIPCHAAEYGCDFVARSSVLDQHLKCCALSKLVPFLKSQNERLENHGAVLKHLRHKNSILETTFSTIQETLGTATNLIDAPPSPFHYVTSSPFDSTSHHLLYLHETLREEVSRVSAAVADLDAKATMMVMNERLRIKDDLSHTNAAIASMRMQLHWLMSARLQTQQRVAMVPAQSSGESLSTGTPNPPAGPNDLASLPVRRLSDSTRQEPKL